MKIKWIDGAKLVPGIGNLETGDIREVPEDIGKNLIKQKQAIKIKAKHKKVRGK